MPRKTRLFRPEDPVESIVLFRVHALGQFFGMPRVFFLVIIYKVDPHYQVLITPT